MSDFTAYRFTKSPCASHLCDDCRTMQYGEMVRAVGRCDDIGGSMLTAWFCIPCHSRKIKDRGAQLEQGGNKEPWLEKDLRAMIAGLPPLQML